MFSQTTEYPLRAVAPFAGQEVVLASTAARISRATTIPSNYLAKVFRSLSRAGLMHSQRGPGGRKRTQNPSELTVLQVINAVDPLIRIQSCPLALKDHQDLCPLDSAIAMAETAFRTTTIAELVSSPTRKPALCQFPCVSVSNLFPREAMTVTK